MATQNLGQWEDDFELDTVAIHASLLPNGKVLYWGRRSDPNGSLNQASTKSFLLSVSQDNGRPTSTATRTQPKSADGNRDVNLFCSGHCLQPDGNLLVVGGHITDSVGSDQTSVYNYSSDAWIAEPVTNTGRWYPSALTLPNGNVFCISGSFSAKVQDRDQIFTNDKPQIWPSAPAIAGNNASGLNWRSVTSPPTLPSLYPRLHLDPNGRIFVAGPQAESQFLDIGGARSPDGNIFDLWKTGPRRTAGGREYAPSVMYDRGKIVFIGGGNEADQNGPPTNVVETIDLNEASPRWTTTNRMTFARRQHNATVLADGTVLVTGGTQGGGFNNLNIGSPIWAAELWDPATQLWTVMAEEKNDRCYHSIALLLPDGRVLSAGGGEYAPDPFPSTTPNPPKDTLRNARLFRPPYLFRTGRRPKILNVQSSVVYGDEFDVTTDSNDAVEAASWIRLGSVTHSNNMNQSFQRVDKVRQQGSKVTFKAPANANLAPPGHYMLFLLNAASPPSIAQIIRIGPPSSSVGPAPRVLRREVMTPREEASLPLRTQSLIDNQDRPPVVVGLTPVCPYGLGPCWGGAFEALRNISDVDVVSPVPDQINTVAFVYTKADVLPDINKWRSEFQAIANGAYTLRGIEITISCTLEKKHTDDDTQQLFATTPTGQVVRLVPASNDINVKWDGKRKAPKLLTESELDAFDRLSAALAEHSASMTVVVTGPLEKYGANAFTLHVRKFKQVDGEASSSKL